MAKKKSTSSNGTQPQKSIDINRVGVELERTLALAQIAADRATDHLDHDDPLTGLLAVIEERIKNIDLLVMGAEAHHG